VDACGTCGERNPERARFCLGCGRPLLGDGAEVRKLVTVLFTDVVGSTDLGERFDPEHYRRVLGRYFDRFQDVVVRHGGTVEKFIGDAVMAVFGLPTAHEDDALRATRAALELRSVAAELAAQTRDGGLVLHWRTGVNTGEVSAGGAGDHTFATGDTINLAARLEQAAAADEILIGASTYELVRDAVEVDRVADLTVKGKAGPVAAYRLLTVDDTAAGRARRFDQPFVGRDAERELLAWVARRAMTTPAVQLVTVTGDPGVGKTRLVSTAIAELAGPRLLWGRCLPYGDGVGAWPLADAIGTAADLQAGDDPATVLTRLRALAGGRVPDRVVADVAAAIGFTDDEVEGDPVDALRRYVTGVAGDDGAVLVIDDLHDGDDALLDLLTALTRARPVPLLLVAIARPELLLRRPSWAGGAANAIALALEPLGDEDVDALLDARLPGGMAPRLRRRLHDAAAGNPLFLEELVTVLLDGGDLARGSDGTWDVADPDGALTVPTSIHGLLAARVDALPSADRDLLGRAAVVGTSFTVAAVAALAAAPPAAVEVELEHLVDRDHLRPWDGGYAFRHPFGRDAVYAGLARRTRAELHEQHADWLAGGPTTAARDELVAHHLERALDERLRLDPDDPAVVELRPRVGERAAVAGRRALARGDMPAAVRWHGRALELGELDPARRTALLAERGRALAEVGDLMAATAELDAAVAAAESTGDPALRSHTRITTLWVRANVDLTGWVDDATAAAHEALEVFTATGDVRGQARAWGLRGEVLYLRAQHEEAHAAVQRAEELARAAGDELEAREAATAGTFILVCGPRHVDEVLASCDALAARYPDDPSVTARVEQMRASVHGFRGDATAAAAALAAARRGFEELGQGFWLASTAAVAGEVAALVGDRDEAEDALRRATDAFTQLGDRAQAATTAALQAAVVDLDRVDDLATLVAAARADVQPDDLVACVRLHLAEARLELARGAVDGAVATIEDAVRVADRSDAPGLQADARLALADALRRRDGAASEPAQRAVTEARERYLGKGHLVGVARADAASRPPVGTASPAAG
jgi:class 3 adenylate cyclase/tetratricopeptide (TPR) repeat protein